MFEFVLKSSWRVVDNFVRHTLKLNIYYIIAYVYIYYMYIIWCSFLNLTSFDFICVGVALASHIAITSFHKKVLQAAQGNFDVSGACELHRPWTASKTMPFWRCWRHSGGVQSCVLRRSLQSLALAEELRTLRPEVGGDFHGTPIISNRGFIWDLYGI